MSEDYLAQAQPTQTWNTVRGVWEKQGIANLLCEHWELFSETWQTSGTMRNGKVYELPTQGPHTTDSEFSSLPTQVFGTVTTATSGRSPEFRKGSNPNSVEFAEDLARHLLRSPTASQGEAEARKRGNTVGIRDNAMDIARLNGLKVSRAVDNLMPTPNTMDHLPARTPEQKALNKGKGGYANVRETVVNDLMPTPIVRDYKDGSAAQMRDGKTSVDTVARAIFNSGEVLLPTTRAQNGEDRNNKIWARNPSKPQNLENALAVTLLPTTRTSMANGPTQKEIKAGNPKTRIETEVMLMPTPTAVDMNTAAKSELDGNDPKHRLKVAAQVLARDKMQWGKFEPAIRRWEQTLGRPSPLPTKPDGKDGAHRLSSAFTEWMMGLPEGWVTGVGLTRNEELKACGNGVVPQQAEMALRSLLQGFGEL